MTSFINTLELNELRVIAGFFLILWLITIGLLQRRINEVKELKKKLKNNCHTSVGGDVITCSSIIEHSFDSDPHNNKNNI